MPRTRPPYPPEFRAEAVRLARSAEQPLARTARDLGVSLETLRAWIKQADLDSGQRTDGLTTAEREELIRLRRENRTLRMEREILVKASAFFAREIDGTPQGCSASSSESGPAIPWPGCVAYWASPPVASTPGDPAHCRPEQWPTRS